MKLSISLETADRTNPASVAAAQAYIDSLKVVLEGGADFEAVARENSQDPSVATNGGDMGKFTQTRMVREFGDVCFITGTKGGTYTTVTDYGVHLIKVEDQIFDDEEEKYRIATVIEPVIPSTTTQDSIYDNVGEMVSESRSIEDLNEALAAIDNIELTSASPVMKNDFSIANLGPGQTSRDIITWMFDSTTSKGDVSPEIYRYTDQVNYYDNRYVIAVLEEIVPKGLKRVDDVRAQIEPIVLNRKKGEKLASEMNVVSLEDLASKYGTQVETASDIAVTSDFVPGVGSEPKVIGSAFNVDVQAVSKPIVGNSGVFVISPLSVNAAPAANNVPFLKKNIATSTKTQVSFKVLQGLRKSANIDDERSTFF